MFDQNQKLQVNGLGSQAAKGETRISWPVDFPDPPSSGEAKL